MIPPDPRARHAELVAAIQAHNYRYYVLDDPSVADAEFDVLMRQLRDLEATHPSLASPDSPTQRVASDVRSNVSKVPHRARMFSLDNAYNEHDVSEFFRRVRTGLPDRATASYVVEPKLDGASVEVVYEGGRLALASTRGDGEVGEEITDNVRTIRGVPATVPHRGTLTLRGEIVIYRKDLETLNKTRELEGLPLFANPRNAAAGAVRMMDPREVAKRPLRAMFYQLVEGPAHHATHAESLDFLRGLGIPTHGREVVVPEEGVLARISAIDGARADYPFETDGAVVKVNAYAQQETLGSTSKFPKWAVAYKFQAERARTTVLDIIVQVGRTGALTPVAVLAPVELAGTTVGRASLHNESQIAELDVRIGDHVYIEKAGEIIPQVISVDTAARTGDERPFAMPRACPECGASVEQTPGLAVVRCINRTCPAQVKAQIFYWARRFAMDIDHLGIALVDQLVERGIVRDVTDLYTLDAGTIEGLERMGEKSATNVVASIAASKARPLDRVLCGLGIPQVGQVAAKQLAEEAGSLQQILGWTNTEARERVGAIHGFGPKMVESVVLFLGDGDQRALMQKLVELSVGTAQPRATVATDGPLLGFAVCVTGVLSRKREDVHTDIRAAGGEIHDSVKRTTTHLVAGEKTGKSKLDQAKKFGTKVIDEGELQRLLGSGGES